jgi:UMF1 family MFS transporter
MNEMEKNDRKTIFGWCMYDWANSAYVTTVAVALLPAYFAGEIVGPEGVVIGDTVYSATTLWGFIVGLAAFLSFLAAPVLGAISDFSAAKKKFLITFAYTGALFTILLYFCHSGDVLKTLLFFLAAQVCFISGNVFYDAFLPQIASEDKMDWVSGKGFAFGYVGGGLQFAIALGLVAGHAQLGLSQTMAARMGIVMAGLWWAGFTLFMIKHLSETPSEEPLPDRYHEWPTPLAYVGVGISRTLNTIRHLGRFRHLVLFLIAYMMYNDGIQTVINMATIYGKEELNLTTTSLMVPLLAIQAIAVFGAQHQESGDGHPCALVGRGHLCILYSIDRRILCPRCGSRNRPRRLPGTQSLPLWFNGSRGSQCPVLWFLYDLQQVFRYLGPSGFRDYPPGCRISPTLYHFPHHFLYLRACAALFC